MNEKYNDYALMFKALSDPNRLLIIDYLLDSERCACKILEQLQISQSTLSYHMKMLIECSIVFARKDGKWMHYTLNPAKFEELKVLLDTFTKDRKNNCNC